MVNTMNLEIVARDGIVFSDDVEMVTFPGSEGQLGILPQHIPFMTQVVPGEIIVHKGPRIGFSQWARGWLRSGATACRS
jgi:F-type H+-transporting ATPase subunit epsilon